MGWNSLFGFFIEYRRENTRGSVDKKKLGYFIKFIEVFGICWIDQSLFPFVSS